MLYNIAGEPYGGVSFSLEEKLKQDMLEFYELPVGEKLRYRIKPGEGHGVNT